MLLSEHNYVKPIPLPFLNGYQRQGLAPRPKGIINIESTIDDVSSKAIYKTVISSKVRELNWL